MKRQKLSEKKSKILFIKTGSKINSLNLQPSPMRGGFRI